MSGILTVCDANVCRSVAAEFLLAEAIAEHAPLAGVDVRSRGVKALEGHAACRSAVELSTSKAWALRAQRHRSTQLDADAVESATLILTATTETRAAVVSMHPPARRRVFTLREALWLADGYRPTADVIGDDRVADLVAHLDRNRGLRPLPETRRLPWRRPEHPFDIQDGHTQGHRPHRSAIRTVHESVERLVGTLVGSTDSSTLAARIR